MLTTTLRLLLATSLLAMIAPGIHAQNCTANAGLDQVICVTQPLTLTGTPGSPQSSTPAYLWTQVSGPACTITSPTATTTTITGFTPGNYVFQFSNRCVDNMFATNLVSITVLPEPPTALAGDDVSTCTAVPITLSGNTPPAGNTGTWTVSPAGGSFSPNANAPNATYTPPAGSNTYTLTWTISNGQCTSSDTKIFRVVLPTSPVSAGTTQTLSCSGNCVTLNGSQPGLAPSQSGFWSYVSGPSIPVFANPNLRNTTACNLVPGTYVFRWSVSGPCLTGSATVTINVSNINVAPAAGGNQSYTTFCSSPTVTSQVLTGGALTAGETAVWTQTGGGTPPYPNVTFTPNTTGSNVTVNGMTGVFPYTFTYVKTNATGCSNSSTHTVYRPLPVTNLSEPANADLACDVQTNTFSVSYDDPAGNITNGLTRNGVRISGPAAGTITFGTTSITGGVRTDTWTAAAMTAPGTYVYRLEYRNSCGSVYRDVAFTVSRTPGTVNAGSSPVLPCNTLFANPIGSASAPTNLTWTQVSGPNTATLSGVNTTSLTMTGLDAGVYLMRLTNSGGLACGAVSSDVLVRVTRAAPTVATTGANQSICAGNYRLTANTPGPLETGTWSVSPSTGVTFSPNANTPNAFVSGLATNTAYTFTWTVSNSCGSINSSQINTTTSSMSAPIPNAGIDICRPAGSTTATLTGNAPGAATILWTALTAGSSVVSANAQSTTANFTGGSGVYLFQYSLSSPGCGSFLDTVAVTINNTVAAPNAGINQSICVATLPASATLTATPVAPTGSTAQWRQINGPSIATIASPNAASTTVSNMTAGVYEFEYRITTGSCSDAADVVAVRISQEPSAAVAGPNQSICNASTSTAVTLAATPPTVGVGYWQVISGPPGSGTPTFSNANAANSTISNLVQGVYTLRWTTINGTGCAEKTSDMTITVGVAANAGVDFALCDRASTNLTGNPNTTGTWSYISGPSGSTVTTNSSNTAVVTGLTSATGSGNVYTFRYSMPAVGACAASSDDVVVTNYAAPSSADAGLDQEVCSNVSTLTLTGLVPVNGTGSWTRISGPNTPTAGTANTNPRDTVLNNLVAGLYIYEYRVQTNAACVASADRMQILKEVVANAGADTRFCNATTVNLAANAPVLNTGTWSYVSGPSGSSFVNANNPSTAVNGLVPGTYVFAWTIAGPGGCVANSDDITVIIDPPVGSVDAGSDGAFCEGTVASFALGSTTIPGATYTWSPSILLNNNSIAQPNFTGVNNAGVYTYTVRANIGSCEAFDAVTVTVRPKPGANITVGSGVCNTSFSATDVGNGVATPISYNWNFGTVGDASPATATGAGPFTITYATGGSKSLNLSVSSGDGCTNSRASTYNYAAGCLLPVTLVSFTANWVNNYARLNWTIADAVNFDRFEIERSYDGVNFNGIGNIPYSSATQYSYEDRSIALPQAKLFYRLKLIDLNGTFTYSGVRIIYVKQEAKAMVAPNPATEKINVWLTGYRSGQTVKLELFDNAGQLVLTKQVVTAQGDHYVEMTGLSKLAPGVYVLRIAGTDEVHSYKVIKQ